MKKRFFYDGEMLEKWLRENGHDDILVAIQDYQKYRIGKFYGYSESAVVLAFIESDMEDEFEEMRKEVVAIVSNDYERLVIDYPNDMELGSKVREMYYNSKK